MTPTQLLPTLNPSRKRHHWKTLPLENATIGKCYHRKTLPLENASIEKRLHQKMLQFHRKMLPCITYTSCTHPKPIMETPSLENATIGKCFHRKMLHASLTHLVPTLSHQGNATIGKRYHWEMLPCITFTSCTHPKPIKETLTPF